MEMFECRFNQPALHFFQIHSDQVGGSRLLEFQLRVRQPRRSDAMRRVATALAVAATIASCGGAGAKAPRHSTSPPPMAPPGPDWNR